MSYTRVIPRDLFNESKLLKCLGQFALIAHDGIDGSRQAFPESVTISHDGAPFRIHQNQDDGGLFCSNFVVRHAGKRILLYTHYNCKSNYPLYCDHAELGVLDVLDDAGNLTPDFIAATAPTTSHDILHQNQ